MLTNVSTIALFIHIRGCQNLPWLERNWLLLINTKTGKKKKKWPEEVSYCWYQTLWWHKWTAKILKPFRAMGMLKKALPWDCTWRPSARDSSTYITNLLCNKTLNCYMSKPCFEGKEEKNNKNHPKDCTQLLRTNNSAHNTLGSLQGSLTDSHL